MRLFVLRSGAGEGGGEAPALSCVFFFSAFFFFIILFLFPPPPNPPTSSAPSRPSRGGQRGWRCGAGFAFVVAMWGASPTRGRVPFFFPKKGRTAPSPPRFFHPPTVHLKGRHGSIFWHLVSHRRAGFGGWKGSGNPLYSWQGPFSPLGRGVSEALSPGRGWCGGSGGCSPLPPDSSQPWGPGVIPPPLPSACRCAAVTCRFWKWKREISCPVRFHFHLLRRGRSQEGTLKLGARLCPPPGGSCWHLLLGGASVVIPREGGEKQGE